RNRPLNCSCLMLLLVTSAIAVDVVKEYILVKIKLTWPRAQNYCRTHHKDLVSIHSKEEVKMLLEKYRDVNIGLEKNASKDQWLWSSREPVNFTNWGENQPNNGGQCEDCVVVEEFGKWHDLACSNRESNYVCFNGSCSSRDLKYHFIQEEKTWFEARDTCRERYTDLVSIELWNINITGGADQKVWISLYQNPWQWSNGDESSFQYWDTNEPNNNADDVCAGVYLKNLNDKGDKHPSEVGYHYRKVYPRKENKTWTEAFLYCQEHYTDLVSITDPQIQKEVAELAKKSSRDGVWIGLRKELLLGFLFWVNGNESDYSNWENTIQMDAQTVHCGYVDKTKNFTWGLQCCLTKLNFICSN
uniref:C-type lectin domain-containing protein n=1 Tax=Latimeria chalumnae TaxID=7897 RepID=H2ZVY2_LATCH